MKPTLVAWATCLTVLSLVASARGGEVAKPAEPNAAAMRPSGGPVSSGAGAAQARPAPARMVLCRSPRGVVFARDAEQGCSKVGTKLTAANLVDFAAGAAGGCAIHSLADAAAAKDCREACRTAEPKSTCVVGLEPGAGGAWATFAADRSLSDLGAARGRALAVCCSP